MYGINEKRRCEELINEVNPDGNERNVMLMIFLEEHNEREMSQTANFLHSITVKLNNRKYYTYLEDCHLIVGPFDCYS